MPTHLGGLSLQHLSPKSMNSFPWIILSFSVWFVWFGGAMSELGTLPENYPPPTHSFLSICESTVYCMNNILYMHPLDQCSTFIMHWPRANLRPIHYTKCPPNRIEKWSQICCISKHNKVGFALLSTREANFFIPHVGAIQTPPWQYAKVV